MRFARIHRHGLQLEAGGFFHRAQHHPDAGAAAFKVVLVIIRIGRVHRHFAIAGEEQRPSGFFAQHCPGGEGRRVFQHLHRAPGEFGPLGHAWAAFHHHAHMDGDGAGDDQAHAPFSAVSNGRPATRFCGFMRSLFAASMASAR